MIAADFVRVPATATPPAGLTGPLLGLWYAGSGNWEAAHDAVRLDESVDAAWVHAHLHRVEGDLDNARYWYTRAGRPFATEALAAEREAIATELLAFSAADRSKLLAGMTVNERLYHLGLIGKWDEAVRQRDRESMMRMMERAEVPNPERTVDAVLTSPERYGF